MRNTKTPSQLLGEQVGREAARWTNGFCLVICAPILWIIVKLELFSWWMLIPCTIFYSVTYIQFFNEIYKVRWKRAMLDSQPKET
jgi:hypothetical protein